jgi:hypothetical protein
MHLSAIFTRSNWSWMFTSILPLHLSLYYILSTSALFKFISCICLNRFVMTACIFITHVDCSFFSTNCMGSKALIPKTNENGICLVVILYAIQYAHKA